MNTYVVAKIVPNTPAFAKEIDILLKCQKFPNIIKSYARLKCQQI